DSYQHRLGAGAEAYIVEALEWCRIPFDEGPGKERGFGPYRQSERQDLYLKYAQELIKRGKAYYAFDTAEALEGHRNSHEAQGKTFIYNWHNRLKLQTSLTLDQEEVHRRMVAGEDYVNRLQAPRGEHMM